MNPRWRAWFEFLGYGVVTLMLLTAVLALVASWRPLIDYIMGR